jgi:hypothetical protein
LLVALKETTLHRLEPTHPYEFPINFADDNGTLVVAKVEHWYDPSGK